VAISGTTHIEERIRAPQVHIDHDLVVIWAPFNFYIDGKLDHRGRDIFSLNKEETANGRSSRSLHPSYGLRR
jgi:hypothetical protein